MKAGVIVNPISHSLSPYIFNYIAEAEKQVIDYQAIEVKADDSLKFLDKFKIQKMFVGVNVTLPLKEMFLGEIDFLSPEVNAIGALNVLHLNGSGINGFNTDIVGIQKTLESENFTAIDKSCLLLGAGGSAKAVAYVLGKSGAKNVFIHNRSGKSQEIISKFSALFPETHWAKLEILKDKTIDLVVNTTPIGMTGEILDVSFFNVLEEISYSENALAFDLIYTPEDTEFLKLAKKQGLRTVGGLGMLIDQALATWKIWIGSLADENNLHLKLKKYLRGILRLRQNPAPIYLTGFMGVGKSSVAEKLSELLNRQFIDIDKVIEASAGLSIPQIFEEKGEPYFRELESDSLGDICSKSSPLSVVSLGGGALMKPENLQVIMRSGILIYLSASEEILLERIESQKSTRPILMNLSKYESEIKIHELLKLRLSSYEKANIQIKTDHLSLREVAYEIISAIGELNH
jgi:shikimate dehydrogenase